MDTDPFEIALTQLLQERKIIAERIMASRPKEYTTDTSRLPFEINKTHQYLKQNQYEKTKKALKKVTTIV